MSISILAVTATAQLADNGLTLDEVVEALPTDPASLFAIFLLLGSVVLVLWSGRSKGGKGGTPA